MTTLWAPAPPQAAGPGVREVLARQRAKRRGRLYAVVRWVGAALFAAVFLAMLASLLDQAAPDLGHMGLSVLWRGWNPAKVEYGAGIFILGTVLTTALALLVAVPVGVGAALVFAELAPGWIAAPLTAMVEFLAAIPSVVVGLWGLIVLTPLFARDVEPFFKSVPGIDAAFHGEPLGSSILLAGVVLAIMVLPTVVALSRVAMSGVALADREAGMALAATRWQVARKVVVPGARRGIRAAVTLAMGRAMGEAIAVAFVIGNGLALPHSLLSPGSSLGSQIVNSFSEALPGSLQRSGVVALVVVLLAISVAVNAGGQILLRRRKPAVPPRGPTEGADIPPGPDPGPVPGEVAPAVDHDARRRELVRVVAARHLRRRRRGGRVASALCVLAVVLALLPLVSLLAYIVARGAPALSLGFLVHTPKPIFVPGNGIGNAIVGTLIIVGLAMVMAVPVGLAASLFVIEGPPKLSAAVRFSADVLTGTPSIAIGVFAAAVIVATVGFSALAGSFALAVLMLPVMVRADEEAMAAVPAELWEAGLALGTRRGRVVRSVVLRSALPGIVTGNLLAMARAIGELAPLLFTIFGSQFFAFRPTAPMAALPLTIFTNATEPFKSAQTTAWGAALVLLVLVVIISVAARATAALLTRKAR